jgi:hypothetical protein
MQSHCKHLQNMKIRYIYGGMIMGVGDQLSELNSHLKRFNEFL